MGDMVRTFRVDRSSQIPGETSHFGRDRITGRFPAA